MNDEQLLTRTSEDSSQLPYPVFRTIVRVARYTLVRAIMLFIAVIIGLYLTILVANLGGFIDKIYEGMINEVILGMSRGGAFKGMSEEQALARIEEIRWGLEEEFGMHEPFLSRTWNWLVRGLTLDFGNTRYNYITNYIVGTSDSLNVRYLISLALPYTLTLMGGANVLVFFISLFVAMKLSLKFGSFWDRLLVALSPISSVPPWVHGIWLIFIFAGQLKLLPYPRRVEILGVEDWWNYIPFLLQYMILPFLAIVIGSLFQGIYFWRSYFLIYAGEDYVDLARAKGLPNRMVERNHILRPTLPYVITSFSLTMIGLWQSAIALEALFYFQGIGNLFISAVRRFDTPVIVGIVVIFAYLLAVTIFILDIIYAVLDPRVSVGVDRRRKLSSKSWRQQLNAWMQGSRKSVSGTALSEKLRQNTGWVIQPASDAPKIRVPRASTWRRVKPVLREVFRYPSALAGALLILILAVVSVFTVIVYPYDQTVALWRREEKAFLLNPRGVPPEWVNFFRKDKLPSTLIMDSAKDTSLKTVKHNPDGTVETTISFKFEYPYTRFPQDLVIFLEPEYEEKPPLLNITWVRPDGKELRLGQFSVPTINTAFYVSQDSKVRNRYGDRPISGGLFADDKSQEGQPIQGTYELRLVAFSFEETGDLEASMVLYGLVHGLAGTDNFRRDLIIALLWGTPVALAFGLLGAVVTTILSMLIAAMGAWFGGWVDDLIQRISEVNLILPTLPIAIMIFIMYSKSIWAILAVVVLLSIFGNGIKIYRAAFLQIQSAPYVESAQAYGAGDGRIILRYLTPRIIPVLVPQLVSLVPGYVFYEATLAYLGISDPFLPTWGKMIFDALSASGFEGNYHWILQPMILLLLTGLAFAMLGFALDRILNPRLRER